MPNNRAVILVSGMVAADPYQGGATWAVLQYLLGFRRLGYDVFFVEPVRAEKLWAGSNGARRGREGEAPAEPPEARREPRPPAAGESSPLAASANAAYVRKVTR